MCLKCLATYTQYHTRAREWSGILWTMKYNLPKSYLSYSAMSLWCTSKDQYRLKYYSDNNVSFSTAYTEFGKFIAETLEDKKKRKSHPVLSKIPAYAVPEQPLEFEVDGVPIKGFIDSFDPKKKRIIEYKTSIKREGRPLWNDVSVKKHNQLLVYALGVQKLFGEVHPLIKLVWMETQWREVCRDMEFGSKVITDCKPELELTGYFEVFKRKIEPWELLYIQQDIVRIAQEISDDYTAYRKASGDS